MRKLGSILSGAFCLVAAQTMAGGSDVLPTGERTITQTAATSTCIGKPVTAACAVESVLACWARAEIDLCRAAGVMNFRLKLPPSPARYRFLEQETITEAHIRARPDLAGSYWFQVGFVDITIEELDYGTGLCGRDQCNKSFWVKPVAGGWEVVAWAAWGFP